MVGSPLRFDGQRADSELPPPGLGEHTMEMLAGQGLGDADVEASLASVGPSWISPPTSAPRPTATVEGARFSGRTPHARGGLGEIYLVRDEAAGTHLVILVNGIVITDFTDPERRHASGHIALQQHNDGSVVECRKLEVRELPPAR